MILPSDIDDILPQLDSIPRVLFHTNASKLH